MVFKGFKICINSWIHLISTLRSDVSYSLLLLFFIATLWQVHFLFAISVPVFDKQKKLLCIKISVADNHWHNPGCNNSMQKSYFVVTLHVANWKCCSNSNSFQRLLMVFIFSYVWNSLSGKGFLLPPSVELLLHFLDIRGLFLPWD